MIPERVAEFRARYRREEIGRWYSGVVHFLFTSTACLSVIALALAGLRAPTAWQLATLPLWFVIANLGEYFGHRGPMHHPRPGLALVYKRHTLQHHHFFTDEAMGYEGPKDVKMVLFPWFLILFFFGGMALPIGIGLYFAVGENVARLFVATAVGYFLTYEWLHFSYHLPDSSRLLRLPVMRALRRHHQRHHDLALMGKHNFNITFPICDLIFGTLYRSKSSR